MKMKCPNCSSEINFKQGFHVWSSERETSRWNYLPVSVIDNRDFGVSKDCAN